MNLQESLTAEIANVLRSLYGDAPASLPLQPTHHEFEGAYTLVCFPLTRLSKTSPELTAKAVGEALREKSTILASYNVVKGFLNLSFTDAAWLADFSAAFAAPAAVPQVHEGEEMMVEYSSPNTNKPLHLGHLRNNFLGWSVSALLEATGYRVHRVQIVNDRGIHICKSMAAWQLYGDGETPQSAGIKGDHLVGKYYVAFDKAYKAQVQALVTKGVPEAEAEKEAPIMKRAVDLLRKWEQKDEETVDLWKTMNGWVYDGFAETYRKMGVTFEKLYYESDTYLLGKEEVMKGLEGGIFFRKEDGSVWVDLSKEGLDEKVLLRADGTSVYITQDIGTAILRFRDFPRIVGEVYTVGSEQEYHFKVLFLILKKLGYAWAEHCYHLSYGMVDLPSGRMKSREGTVVDADDLMEEMNAEAEKQTMELGKIESLTATEARELYHAIAMGALKFFLLKVDPKRRMLFDPSESIQLQGFTGPFIQYTHARISAILRKAVELGVQPAASDIHRVESLEKAERDVIILLGAFGGRVLEAAREYAPSILANYLYELAREYNQFYQAIPIFAEEDTSRRSFRVALSGTVGRTLQKGLALLGIQAPEKM